jgi:cytochrome c-type biogenesis protein CcmH
MILTFVLIAGTLAAGAALLVLLPLLRRRADARPTAAVAAVAVLLVMLLGGAGLYAAFSNYTWTDTSMADSPAAMTARLAKRLAKQSGSLDEWLLLGHSYVKLGQYPLALRAYQRADQMAQGRNAEAIMSMAEVLVQQDVEELRGRAGRMFEHALELDPNSRKAMFYSAFAALGRNEPALARQRFGQMLSNEQDPEVRALLEKGLESAAQQEARLAGGPESSAATADAAKITVHVTLAPALAAKIPSGAALFVAARDPRAPGPPFAVKRLAAQFPIDVELTAADAMMPSRRIAAGQQLDVVARVALGGTPTASSGDPFGQVSYHVGKDGRLNIVIDRLAP